MIILDKFLNGWDRLWWTCAVSARNGHQGLSATDDRQGWARRLQTTCCGGNCFSLSESEECLFVDRELNPKHVHLHKIQPSVISTFLSNIRKRRRASNLCYYLCNEQHQDWSRGRGWIKENVENLFYLQTACVNICFSNKDENTTVKNTKTWHYFFTQQCWLLLYSSVRKIMWRIIRWSII